MIDEEKILKASRGYCDATYGTLSTDPFIAEGFRQGAQWAQKEFVNSLWHSSEEKPKEKGYIITMCFDGVNPIIVYKLSYIVMPLKWEEYCHNKRVVEWCYLSDILPQKGGEE